MNYDVAEVDRLSETTQEQRDKNLRWLLKQGELTRIEATTLQTDLIRQHRQRSREQGVIQTNTPEFIYAMFSLALSKMVWLQTAHQHKGTKLQDEDFTKVQEIRMDRIKAKRRKKTSLKKEVIRVRFYSLIQRLRDKGQTWREIADYISTYEQVKLAHSYIRQIFMELSAERKAEAELKEAMEVEEGARQNEIMA